MKIYLIIILFALNSTRFFAAQDSSQVHSPPLQYDTSEELTPVNFNAEEIEEYKDQNAFAYLNEVESYSWWSRFKNWLDMKLQQLVNWLFGDYEAHSLVSFLLTILPYLLVVAILGFIIWLFIKLNPGASFLAEPEKPEVYLSEEEELVHSGDLGDLIEKAINNRDYRLAVRYYYLQLLRLLNENELITYEYQKTDSEYLAEITAELKAPFKKILRLYDFIWYGNFPVTAEDFSRVQNSFLKIRSSIIKPAGSE